jgi:hypothetical protein
MKTLEVNEATGSLAEYARNLGSEPLAVTEAGRTLAVLMPVEEDDVDSLAIASSPEFQAILEKARAERRSGLGRTADDVRRELGLLS